MIEALPKILAIIAGHNGQVRAYVEDKALKPGEWFYVWDAKTLRGRKNINYVLIGTFFERKDILQLKQLLKQMEIAGDIKRVSP